MFGVRGFGQTMSGLMLHTNKQIYICSDLHLFVHYIWFGMRVLAEQCRGLVLQTKTVYSGGWKSFLGQDCNGYNEIGDPDNAVRDVDNDSLDDAYVNYDNDGDDDDDDADKEGLPRRLETMPWLAGCVPAS